VVTESQLAALRDYCAAIWLDCLELERMWLAGELDDVVKIEEEELAIARLHPGAGAPAIMHGWAVQLWGQRGGRMTITVKPDWWKAIFDEVYLLTDARSVCNDEITQRGGGPGLRAAPDRPGASHPGLVRRPRTPQHRLVPTRVLSLHPRWTIQSISSVRPDPVWQAAVMSWRRSGRRTQHRACADGSITC